MSTVLVTGGSGFIAATRFCSCWPQA